MANKYLHLFETEQEFQEAYNGNDYEAPWVSLTNLTGSVHYNKITNDLENINESELL